MRFDQRRGLGGQTSLAKIAANALFKIFGLTHIENSAVAIKHLIDAGSTGQGCKKRLVIKSHGAIVAGLGMHRISLSAELLISCHTNLLVCAGHCEVSIQHRADKMPLIGRALWGQHYL